MTPLIEYNKSCDKINITSISSGLDWDFFAFITNFSDAVSPSWSSTDLYSRMDPIYSYKHTTRKIDIAFDVPSDSLENARTNFNNMQQILDSMYPVFDEGKEKSQGSSIVNGPPIFKISFANFTEFVNDINPIMNVSKKYLLGIIQNITFKPDIQMGFFIGESGIYPKLYKVNFTFNVLNVINANGDTGHYMSSGSVR